MDEEKELRENELPAVQEGQPADPSDAEEPAVTEDAEETPAIDDRVFGMPRLMFYFMVIGYAMGAIVSGLLGILGLVQNGSSTMIPGTIGAVLGYFLFKILDRHRKAKASDRTKQ